jgi:UDP-N-acetylmuramate--alanine ligase
MVSQATAPTIPEGRVHLIGIGGAGMSALAQVLIERGHPVSGSDLRGGRATASLQAMGAQVGIGHRPEHVVGAHLVVVSTAIPEHNPEVEAARRGGVPVIRRAELLAALLEGYRGLLVAGTHGKTTTTSMIAVALQAAGLDPSFAIGGQLHEAGTSAHHGTGDVFVAEADESDGSFLVFQPDCAIVTNVELDHPDHYSDLDAVERAFAAFLDRRRPGGPVIACADDPGVRRLLDGAEGPILTYGQTEGARLRITDITLEPGSSSFSLARDGDALGRFSLRMPGEHNVANATAAVAGALWSGAEVEAIRSGLAAFSGTQRRFQRLGEAGGVLVIDDYAHHPTELAATVKAARQTRPEGRVVAVFQPHRYSRTEVLGHELGVALAGADLAVIADVYAAGEAPVAGVTGALVAAGAEAEGVATTFVPGTDSLVGTIHELVRPGDLVLTLGAGDISEVGPLLLRRLQLGGAEA